jgi:hypothetical protein
MNAETKPCVVAALERYDYPTRVAALRLIGCGPEVSSALDDTTADPRLLREVLMLLSRMAWAGLLEYYGQWDSESAHWCLSREHSLAEDLANIEAELFQNDDGSTPLKAEAKAELAQREAEIRAAWQPLPARPAWPPQPVLPPGSTPSPRAIAIMRQRDAAE